MKKLFILSSIALVLASCNEESKKEVSADKVTVDLINNPASLRHSENAATPVMKFEKKHHTFGEIVQGEKVRYTFKFKNEGNLPLIINNARSTCGCTVPEWPKQPIAAGEEGSIEVLFNSEGKMGNFNKTITIKANTNPNMNKVSISGNIVMNH